MSELGENQDVERREACPAILVVEDDAGVRDLLAGALSDAGYSVEVAGSRSTMLEAIERKRFDLITLDLTLGAEDGLEIAAEVRSRANIPVIMISGRGEPMDRVAGLESGADDYITKPFHVKEVLIRVKAILQRYASPAVASHAADSDAASEVIHFDHSVLDLKRRSFFRVNGTSIELTETEFDLLALLVNNPGRILSRDEIWYALRGHERHPLDRTLDGHIAHLRGKIESAGLAQPVVKSVRGVGYVFIGDVGEPTPPTVSTAS